jgi:hypothetical protein
LIALTARGGDVLLCRSEEGGVVRHYLPSRTLVHGESLAGLARSSVAPGAAIRLRGAVYMHAPRGGVDELWVGIETDFPDRLAPIAPWEFHSQEDLPASLEPTTARVLDALCRAGPLAELWGTAGSQQVLHEVTPNAASPNKPSTRISESESPRSTVAERSPVAPRRSFAARAGWFTGAAMWTSAVFLAFDASGMWRGRTAIFALILCYGVALASATLAGSYRKTGERPVKTWGLLARASGILVVGLMVVLPGVFLMSAVLGSAMLVPAILAACGIPVFYFSKRAVSRSIGHRAPEDALTVVVRRLILATLALTTMVALTQPRFLQERMRHRSERHAGQGY